ncbi:MAG: YeeE/YedE family protein [Verrucomicrobia bacterium]|nr:YeeE/YedE family protein [Verrucomicrobiota bacterium]
MNTAIFSSPSEMIAGLLIGVLFGFVLQKAQVTRFSTIVGQLLLRDFTVMKVILTAIGTGSFLLYALNGQLFNTALIISTTTLFAAALGGGIFGVGMAVLGFCPGTCVGALSLNAKDAWYGIAGMIVGAGIYAELYPWIKLHVKPDSQISKTTLPEYFNISPWFFIGAVALFVTCLIFFDNYQRAKQRVHG